MPNENEIGNVGLDNNMNETNAVCNNVPECGNPASNGNGFTKGVVTGAAGVTLIELIVGGVLYLVRRHNAKKAARIVKEETDFPEFDTDDE